MHIVEVFIHVKPDRIREFEAATLENARNSLKEPGIARFDVLRQADDPTRFVLLEAYRSAEDPARHKQTDHYNRWQQIAEPLMAEPRTRIVYASVFPTDQDWG
jgi:quinol monooxygenase YgiN